MSISLDSRLKNFYLTVNSNYPNYSDLLFLIDQINFQPLDANGNPLEPIDPPAQDPTTKTITFTYNITLPDGTHSITFTDPLDYRGIRFVSGLYNNLETGQGHFGQANYHFLRFTDADYTHYVKPGSYYGADNYGGPPPATGPGHTFAIASDAAPDYSVTGTSTTDAGGHVTTTITHMGNVVDYTPRMISQTISSQAAMNVLDARTPEQIAAAEPGAISTDVDPGKDGIIGTLDDVSFIRNLNTLPGDPSTTGLFTLFGQFFDHGLDFIAKDSAYKITIPLATDDPMRAGADGIFGNGDDVSSFSIQRAQPVSFETIVDANGNPVLDANGQPRVNPEYTNHTSPYIDQSQSYGSDPQITTLLREWVLDPNTGQYRPGMKFFDGTSLADTWTRWDGTQTHQTVPTLAELRAHVEATGRDALTWDDILNYRARDANGHVIDTDSATNGVQAQLTNESLLLDMNPHIDGAHVSQDALDAFNAAFGTTLTLATLNFGTVFPYINPADFSIKPMIGMVPMTQAQHDAVGGILLDSVGDHYITGDGRANENFGLTSLHHVFHEEHQFQIDNLIQTMETALVTPGSGFGATQIHDWQIAVNQTGPATGTGISIVNGHYEDSLGNYTTASGAISWDQDRMFQGAKLITEMEYQHVAIDQYARLVTPDLPEFVTYDSGIDASLSLEYSQAAFRFGHSQLRETIDAIETQSITGGFDITGAVTKYALSAAFLNPSEFADVGPGSILLGMSHQVSNEIDEFVTPALQQTLLGQALDLAAINIARGRDLGIPTLNETRAQLFAASQTGGFPISGDLHPYTSWSDFGANMIHPESLVNFIAAYSFDGDVAHAKAIVDASAGIPTGIAYLISKGYAADEQSAFDFAAAFLNNSTYNGAAVEGSGGYNSIDLWIGGLAEKHVFTGQLGATFNAIFVDQMERLMDGDRFYYLYRLIGALPQQTNLNEQIVTEQFKDIIERTTGTHHLTGDVFGYADSYIELGEQAADTNNNGTIDRAERGAQHKYYDLIASQHLGVLSGDGASTGANGFITTGPDGKQYILDNRPDTGTNPDGITAASGYNSHEVIGGTQYDDYIKAGDGDDTAYGDGGNDYIDGGGGADHIYGGAGNDLIYGGDVEDFLDGGDGNDIIYAGTSSGGIDVVIGGLGDDRLFGEAGIDEMYGGDGDDYIDAGGDTDVVEAGAGNDFVTGGDGPDELHGGIGDDVLDGGAGDDVMLGEDGDDILQPGIGASVANDGDRLDGGVGFDMASYANLNAGVQVTADLTQQNIDRAGPLGNTFLALEGVIGSRNNDILIGDDANNYGSADGTVAGGNWLIGGGGKDTMTGNGGNDVMVGGSIELGVLNQILSGAGFATHFTGLESAAWETSPLMLGDNGASANDAVVLSGKFSDYTITTSVVNGHTIARLVDNGGPGRPASDGTDLVIDVANFQFTDGVRGFGNLAGDQPGSLTAAATINQAAGTVTFSGAVADPDGIIGTPAYQWRQSVDGGAFANIAGATGQTYTPGPSANNTAVQQKRQIQLSSTYNDAFGSHTLNSQTYNLQLGSNASNTGINALIGTLLADILVGFGGSDTYQVNNAGDIVVEGAGGGADTVFASINSYALTANVENLLFNGAGDFVGIGNNLNNQIMGSGGNDTLTGGAGSDTLAGGTGTDTAVFAGTSDQYNFSLNGDFHVTGPDGTDTLTGIETLQFGDGSLNVILGTAGTNIADALVGTSGNDLILGGGGNDRLTGGGGNDILSGGTGTDVAAYLKSVFNYHFAQNAAGNLVISDTSASPTEGTDTLISIEQVAFGPATYNLRLGNATTGSAITGNNTNELIVGGSGNDSLTGNGGKDLLVGGVGADTFVFTNISQTTTGANRDVILDFLNGVDHINLSGIDANGSGGGNPAFSFDGLLVTVVAGTGQVSRQHVGYHIETDAGGVEHTIVEGRTASGTGNADFQIDLVGHHNLTATDFNL